MLYSLTKLRIFILPKSYFLDVQLTIHFRCLESRIKFFEIVNRISSLTPSWLNSSYSGGGLDGIPVMLL